MVREENLDVRAVTLGINLNVCANPDPDRLVEAVDNMERMTTATLED